jgi:argininosuccinate synthase
LKRIVLGYSGGLDTSVAIPWLAEKFKAEVVAVVLDLGQGPTLVEVRERALAAGAVRCHVLDVREEFVRDFMLPALHAGALDERRYPMGRVLSHSLIVKRLVQVARMEGATAIAHGGAKATDLQRFDALAAALEPSIDLIAPSSIWKMSAADRIEYATTREIAVPNIDSLHSIHSTIWGRSIELRTNEQAEDVYTLTRTLRACPEEPAYLEIEFEAGVPTGANGIHMSLVELIESLELIAGAHGVGRVSITGAADGGAPEVFEAPAAAVLTAAYAGLEELILDRELGRAKLGLSRVYGDLIYQGGWFSHTRQAIDAFVASIEPRATGSVRVKLEKGDCRLAAELIGSPAAVLSRN